MPFIGNTPNVNFTSFAKQNISGNGGGNYTLSHAVANENEIEVFVNNVRQEPGNGKAYTASGTALSMTGNVASSDTFYVVFLGKALQTTVTPDASVTTAKLADNAVNLTSKVTGVLPSSKGGTGHSALIAFACKKNLPSSGADSSTNDTIVFNQVQLNIGNAYNSSNGRFTAPVAGIYSFSFFAVTAGASGGAQPANSSALAYFYKNNADAGFGRMQSRVNVQTSYANIAGTIAISLAVNDYVNIHVASQFILVAHSQHYNQFSGHLIGVA